MRNIIYDVLVRWYVWDSNDDEGYTLCDEVAEQIAAYLTDTYTTERTDIVFEYVVDIIQATWENDITPVRAAHAIFKELGYDA